MTPVATCYKNRNAIKAAPNRLVTGDIAVIIEEIIIIKIVDSVVL